MQSKIIKGGVKPTNQNPPPKPPNMTEQDYQFYLSAINKPSILTGVGQSIGTPVNETLNGLSSSLNDILKQLQDEKFWLNSGGIILGLILIIIAFSVIGRGTVANTVTSAIKKGKK